MKLNLGLMSRNAAPMPGHDAQTLFMSMDGYLPTGSIFTRAGNAWNPETGLIASANAPRYVTGKTGQAILIEEASTNKCTAHSVPRADSLGAELFNIAIFGVDAGSVKSGSDFVFNTANAGVAAYNAALLTQGKFYTITYTLNVTSGSISTEYNTPVLFGMTRTASGTYTETIQALGLGNIAFKTKAGGFVGTVSGITIKEQVDIVGTKAYHNGTAFQNPIPNMTLSGDVAAVLSIVTDQAAIDAAIALNPTDGSMVALQAAKANGYKVYKLDNSAGVGNSIFTVSGGTINTNIHSINVVARGHASGSNGQIGFSNASGSLPTITGTSYAPYKSENRTPVNNNSVSGLIPAGKILYFLAPQLEELPYSTSQILCNGVATTRAAETLTYPTVGVLTPGRGTIAVWVYADGGWLDTTSTHYLFGTTTSGNNNRIHIAKTAGTIQATTYSAAGVVGPGASKTITLTKGWHYIAATWGSTELALWIDGIKQTGFVTNPNVPSAVGATFNVSAHPTGSTQADQPLDNLRIFSRPLTAAEILKLYQMGR